MELPLPEEQLIELLNSVKVNQDKIGLTKKVTNDLCSIVAIVQPNVSRYAKKSLTIYLKHLNHELECRIDEPTSEDF